MPKFSNSKLVGACELWQPEFSVSASDDNSMDGTATFISASPECPLAFGDSFPFPGFPSLGLVEYSSCNFGGGLYKITCTFKASTVDDNTETEEEEGGESGGDDEEETSEETVDGGEDSTETDKEEATNDTWTVSAGLTTRPLSEHANYKNFDAKQIESNFALLADGKLDVQAFFEHGVCIPINPNDVNFNPSAYSGISNVMNLDNDFLSRLLKGNTIFFAPIYSATINNIGEPKDSAHGLNGLLAGIGANLEVTSSNTVTENGVKRSTTTLQQVDNSSN